MEEYSNATVAGDPMEESIPWMDPACWMSASRATESTATLGGLFGGYTADRSSWHSS